jgi:hypothetical protein
MGLFSLREKVYSFINSINFFINLVISRFNKEFLCEFLSNFQDTRRCKEQGGFSMKKSYFLTGLIALLLMIEAITNVQSPALAQGNKERVSSKQTSHTKRHTLLNQKGPTPAITDSSSTDSSSTDSSSTDSSSTDSSYKNSNSISAVTSTDSREGASASNVKNSPPPGEMDDPKQSIKPQFATGLFSNALKPLTTPTYEKSGQAVHPSVIDFKIEYNLENWRGYRYWMVMTPYPDGYDRFENPSLLASKDGVTWIVPEGLSKPIDVRPGAGNFNSDPTLVYDPDEKSLLIYWRETLKGEYDRIWRIKYLQNGKLEPKKLVLEEPWGPKKLNLAMSPTVWRKSANEWYLWTVSGTHSLNLYDSSDGIKWSNRRETQAPWTNWNGGFIPWHLEIKPNLSKGKLDIIMSGWPKGKKLTDMVLVYAESPIRDLSTITLPLDQPLVTSGLATQWDDDFIYKSTFVREDKDGKSLYHIWYSARSTAGKWHMGYTSGTISATP